MDIKNTLAKADLRVTGTRVKILELFSEKEFAFSENMLEEKLSQECDRVTIYRTLKTFMEKGILHRVLDENNIVKYALCGDQCAEDTHNHEHAHFKCEQCGHTLCLDNVPIQPVDLPKGYQQRESNLLIIGICGKCGKIRNN